MRWLVIANYAVAVWLTYADGSRLRPAPPTPSTRTVVQAPL